MKSTSPGIGSCLALLVIGWVVFMPAAHSDEVLEDAKNSLSETARDFKKGAKKAGESLKELGSDIGHGANQAAHETGRNLKQIGSDADKYFSSQKNPVSRASPSPTPKTRH